MNNIVLDVAVHLAHSGIPGVEG